MLSILTWPVTHPKLFIHFTRVPWPVDPLSIISGWHIYANSKERNSTDVINKYSRVGLQVRVQESWLYSKILYYELSAIKISIASLRCRIELVSDLPVSTAEWSTVRPHKLLRYSMPRHILSTFRPVYSSTCCRCLSRERCCFNERHIDRRKRTKARKCVACKC